MRRKLLPIVIRILQTGPPGKKRQALLRLVVEAYAHHVRVRDTIRMLRARLRDHLNDAYGDMFELGIVDPAKVTRSALQNAVSIAAMMLTTDTLVTDLPEKHAPVPAGGPDYDDY